MEGTCNVAEVTSANADTHDSCRHFHTLRASLINIRFKQLLMIEETSQNQFSSYPYTYIERVVQICKTDASKNGASGSKVREERRRANRTARSKHWNIRTRRQRKEHTGTGSHRRMDRQTFRGIAARNYNPNWVCRRFHL